MSLDHGYSVIMREIHCALCDYWQQFTFIVDHDTSKQISTQNALGWAATDAKKAGWRSIGGRMTCPKHRKPKVKK